MKPLCPACFVWLAVCLSVLPHCVADAAEAGDSYTDLVAFSESTTIRSTVRLVAWDPDHELTFQQPDDVELKLSARAIARYGWGANARKGEGVLLVDGSLLSGRISRIDAQICEVDGDLYRVQVPRSLVRALLFHTLPLAEQLDQFLDRSQRATGQDDLLVLVNGDVVAGTWDSSTAVADPLVANNRNRPLDPLEFTVAGKKRSFLASRVRGLICCPLLTPWFNASTADSQVSGDAAARWDIGLSDGTRLHAQSLDTNELGITAMVLVCGARLEWTSSPLPLSTIHYLSSLSFPNRLLRLNRKTPLRVRQIPWVGPAQVIPQGGESGFATDQYGLSRPVRVQHSSADKWAAEAIQQPLGQQQVFRLSEQELGFRPTHFHGQVFAENAFQTYSTAHGPLHEGSKKPLGLYARISLVGANGKPQVLWEREVFEIASFDLEVASGAALVLECLPSKIGAETGAEGTARTLIWLDPVLGQ